MLEAYFDDSGRGGKEGIMTLAGFLSTTEQWKLFNAAWQAELDTAPALKCFKMKHAMRPSYLWRSLDENARMNRLNRFHSLICEYTLLGFGCIVYYDAFKTMIQDDLSFADTIYIVAFLGTITNVIRHLKILGHQERVSFVFDRQMKEFSRSVNYLKKSMKDDDDLCHYIKNMPHEASDEEALPLQAADYLAWQLRRHVASLNGSLPPAHVMSFIPPGQHKSVQPEDLPIIVDVWDRGRLRAVRNDVLKHNLGKLAVENLPDNIREIIQQYLTKKLYT